VIEVAPYNTSRRCSSCGWVHINNRNYENFCCLSCHFTANADYNASLNIKKMDENTVIKGGNSEEGYFFNMG
jgi:transposase